MTRFYWAVVPVVVGAGVLAVAGLARAHETEPAGPGGGLGFGVVVALTVALGVVGGALVLRYSWLSTASHPSPRLVALLLVLLGGWAAVLAVLEGPGIAIVVVPVGALVTWSLRNHVVGGHRGCDQAALGSVALHRFVEGALLATLYGAAVALGIGAALVLAAHSAVETGAVAGLWGPGRQGWTVVVLVQTAFVAGAVGGTFVAASVSSLTSIAVLSLLGGALIAAGVATARLAPHPVPTPG